MRTVYLEIMKGIKYTELIAKKSGNFRNELYRIYGKAAVQKPAELCTYLILLNLLVGSVTNDSI